MIEFQRLMAEALRQESIDPMLAAGTWRRSLELLPPDSPEYQQIAARISTLTGGHFGAPPDGRGMPDDAARPDGAAAPIISYRAAGADPKSETWQSVLLKTGGSMALSMAMFAQLEGWPFAIGFVLLIFVHEMGHVIANWYYGLRQSPPIFLGYLGAVIFLRSQPRDAKVEGVVGISGPIAGTLGALGVYAYYLKTGNLLALELSTVAFWMNAFNLLPVPPLDGGRTTAALSPKLWVLGVAGLVGYEVMRLIQTRSGSFISAFLILYILRSALPRIAATLKGAEPLPGYYRISAAARLAIGTAYFGLIAVLALLAHLTGWHRLMF